MTEVDTDVAVVGCGPVGVMAALRCAQRGLRVVAIDKSTEIYPLPRAVGMDDETQEVFSRAGLLAPLRANSVALPGAEFVDVNGTRVVGLELPDGTLGPLGHPPVVTFDQPALEAALREAATAAGVDLRLGEELVSLRDTAEGAHLDLAGERGDVTVRARWVIGADGAKSTVRPARGIELIDQGFDQTWLVVDTTLLDPGLPLPRLAQQLCDPARVRTFVPGPAQHRRWEFRLLPGESRDDVLTESGIERFLAPWGRPDQLRVDRAAVYRFHATVADRFRDGAVFLAGDAAHQMPPFNGQGMCTGIRDAENLAWKLAHVAQGLAGEALLDTYDEERRPHAAGQVAHSVDAGLLLDAIAHDGDAALESGYGQRPFPRLTGSGFIDDHPAIGTVLPNPAGPRESCSDGWTVIVAGAESTADASLLGAAVETVDHAAFGGLLATGTCAIVRPDRYIAAVTADPDAVLRQLASWAGHTSVG